MPSRILSSEKIMKGERRAGEKTKFSLVDYAEILSSIKIVKGKQGLRLFVGLLPGLPQRAKNGFGGKGYKNSRA